MRRIPRTRWLAALLGCAVVALPTARSVAQPQHQEPTRVDVIDVAAHAQRLTRVFADSPQREHPYYQSRFGSVGLHVLSYRQILPLHLHRVAHVAFGVVAGRSEVVQLRETSQGPARHTELHGPGSLVYAPPYSGHRWANPSADSMSVILLFSAPPLMPPLDTHVFVDADDDRLPLGAAPWSLDAGGELQALRESGRASARRLLPGFSGKLSSLALSGATTLDPSSGPSFVFAASGSGSLHCAESHRLPPRGLAFVPRNMGCRVEADADAPLALILFRPEDDDAGDILRHGEKLYSQADEELIIRDFFGDRRGGVFLDVGAAHYRRDSTTYYLERHLGWTGVAVDALAEFAPDYHEHRKATRFVNYLVTDRTRGDQTFYRADGYVEVSSVSKKAAEDQALRYRGSAAVSEISVPSITLTELLDQLEITAIDFLSMDIEEHEPAALAGFDIRRFRPELVCIEAHAMVQDAIFRYFTEHGYRRLDRYVAYDRFNWYFTPVDSAP